MARLNGWLVHDPEGEAIGSYSDEPLYHASLDPAAYEQLLVRAHLPDDPECGQHTVWLATYDAHPSA